MSGRINETINYEYVDEAILAGDVSAEHRQKIIDWLKELIPVLKAIASDQETEKAKHFGGITPAQRRKEFGTIIRKLEDIQTTLLAFRNPMLRYQENKDIPPTRPEGLNEFRIAMSNRLTRLLSTHYISEFGIKPIQWNSSKDLLEHINTLNKAAAIHAFAEEILMDILNEIALSLRDANLIIETNTPAGGPRSSRIRETLLLNLVVLWERINQRTTAVTYSGGETKFFMFCRALCRSIDLGALCTETHLIAAVKTFNFRTFPKTPPENQPSLKDFVDR